MKKVQNGRAEKPCRFVVYRSFRKWKYFWHKTKRGDKNESI